MSEAQVVVVRAPGEPVDLRCGGVPMLAEAEDPPEDAALDPADDQSILIGKRYADDEIGIELLCSRGGAGSLTVNGVLLPMKGAKPLPSSD